MAADAKAAARDRIERAREQLLDLSHRIHAEPELGMEEERASAWLSDALSGAGFTVERGVGGLDTAFSARSGPGPFRVVVCAEYDALPGIGHACGHNVIAAMSVGAGLGLAAVADDVGVEVTVLGTPAEESGGGKIILLEQGAFAGTHAAMMVHPSPFDVVETPIIAVDQLNVTYTGKAAHASAFPELGVNAADAMVVAQTAIGLLRQHLRASDRVHGIVTKGGDAPNVVPARTEGTWLVRPRPRRAPGRRGQGHALLRGGGAGHRGQAGGHPRAPSLCGDAPRPRPGLALPRQRRGVGPQVPGLRQPRAYRRVDRHGQRLPCGAVDPPVDRDRLASRRQPPTRVHSPVPNTRRRQGRHGRRRRHGLDRHRRRHRRPPPHPPDDRQPPQKLTRVPAAAGPPAAESAR
jgi:Peptidase dimerisation domain